MFSVRRVAEFAATLTVVALVLTFSAPAQQAKNPFNPTPGMPGKDSVWMPTPYATLEKMLDVAKLTPNDFVMDLGSGDGRAIITAAKRGTPGLGIEWNQDLVDLSNKLAKEAGVSHLAKFQRGDMFTADISKATVLALFMLPTQLRVLTPKFLALKPGSRIVVNGFAIPDWSADATEKATGDCGSWCTVHLYIVPAQAGGTWRLGDAELSLVQTFQMIGGRMVQDGNSTWITNGKMTGEEITFTLGDARYTGRIDGDTMSGEITGPAGGGKWTATRK